jgi:hypothetical protein
VPALADEAPADLLAHPDPVRVAEASRGQHPTGRATSSSSICWQILIWMSRERWPKTRTDVNLASTSGRKWAAASCSTKRRTEARETPSSSMTPAEPMLEVAMMCRSERSSVWPLASVTAASSIPRR